MLLISHNLIDKILLRISDNLTPHHHIPALRLLLFGMLICSVVLRYGQNKKMWHHFYPSFWNCLAKVDMVINTM